MTMISLYYSSARYRNQHARCHGKVTRMVPDRSGVRCLRELYRVLRKAGLDPVDARLQTVLVLNQLGEITLETVRA